ncbi:hypothetical protein E2C01_033317 [Portunus trituberculatus]|uniref:Uncharacterized protein n=1 Tax=Portunus trituberculatus TaxID=210409 RepID=A0A5B7F3Q5_PORTR|nr:hypothetical protein [Portunus trituberculatus]
MCGHKARLARCGRVRHATPGICRLLVAALNFMRRGEARRPAAFHFVFILPCFFLPAVDVSGRYSGVRYILFELAALAGWRWRGGGGGGDSKHIDYNLSIKPVTLAVHGTARHGMAWHRTGYDGAVRRLYTERSGTVRHGTGWTRI